MSRGKLSSAARCSDLASAGPWIEYLHHFRSAQRHRPPARMRDRNREYFGVKLAAFRCFEGKGQMLTLGNSEEPERLQCVPPRSQAAVLRLTVGSSACKTQEPSTDMCRNLSTSRRISIKEIA